MTTLVCPRPLNIPAQGTASYELSHIFWSNENRRNDIQYQVVVLISMKPSSKHTKSKIKCYEKPWKTKANIHRPSAWTRKIRRNELTFACATATFRLLRTSSSPCILTPSRFSSSFINASPHISASLRSWCRRRNHQYITNQCEPTSSHGSDITKFLSKWHGYLVEDFARFFGSLLDSSRNVFQIVSLVIDLLL